MGCRRDETPASMQYAGRPKAANHLPGERITQPTRRQQPDYQMRLDILDIRIDAAERSAPWSNRGGAARPWLRREGEPSSSVVRVLRREKLRQQAKDAIGGSPRAERGQGQQDEDSEGHRRSIAWRTICGWASAGSSPRVPGTLEPSARDGLAKAFVRVGMRQKTSRPGRTPRRRMEASNWLRSAGYMQPENLRGPRYEVLWGAVSSE